jgi:hypothetical protein
MPKWRQGGVQFVECQKQVQATVRVGEDGVAADSFGQALSLLVAPGLVQDEQQDGDALRLVQRRVIGDPVGEYPHRSLGAYVVQRVE